MQCTMWRKPGRRQRRPGRGLQIDAGVEADVANLVATAKDGLRPAGRGLRQCRHQRWHGRHLRPRPKLWTEVLRVNLIGPWLMVKHAGKAMADAGHGGSIICTASVAGIRSGAGGPAYSASKAGVINLAMVSAQQLCDTGVRVNAICPGLTETGMTAPTFDYAKDKGVTHKLGRLNPLRRAAQPEELAQVACSWPATRASYVNGQAIAVDGG
jgi:NAD(P)-dependent dehydrogenase (short-subunit alcohol dehydrogenase family)